MRLFKNMRINKYAIKLIDNKQHLYGTIYALNLTELETLEIFNKTHLKTSFI